MGLRENYVVLGPTCYRIVDLHRPGKWLIRRATFRAKLRELPKKLDWLALSLSKIVYPKLSGCPETGRENSTCLQNSTCLFYLSTKFYLSILLVTRYSTCLFYLSTKFYLSRGILLVYKKFYLSILLV